MEFKTCFGKIVELCPRGTKAKNHVFGGNLLNAVLFFSNEKTSPNQISNLDPEGSFVK